ncbi:MAG: hypothetical protein ACHQVK_01280, partial [Candidatus Paceibacterales bacterium]
AQRLQDCKSGIAPFKDTYKSIFVGRLSYNIYIVSEAALYLINPKVKPATVFIIDIPGIQNTAEYGSRIADQLESAPKPMLAFLEIGDNIPETNQTRYMKSEGKIEYFLSHNKHLVIATCAADERNFEVRLYQ